MCRAQRTHGSLCYALDGKSAPEVTPLGRRAAKRARKGCRSRPSRAYPWTLIQRHKTVITRSGALWPVYRPPSLANRRSGRGRKDDAKTPTHMCEDGKERRENSFRYQVVGKQGTGRSARLWGRQSHIHRLRRISSPSRASASSPATLVLCHNRRP